MKDKSIVLIQPVLDMTRSILYLRKMKEIRKSYDSQGQVELPDEPFAHTCRMSPTQKGMKFILGKSSFCFVCLFLLWIMWPIICQYKPCQGVPAAESSPEECFAETLTWFLLEKIPVGQFSFRHECVDLLKRKFTSDEKPAGWWQQKSILCFEITAPRGIKEFC